MDFSIFYKFFFLFIYYASIFKILKYQTYRKYGSSNWKKEYLKTYMHDF